jgi:hypothetical protein
MAFIIIITWLNKGEIKIKNKSHYIIMSLVGPKVILKAGDVAMMGLGVGFLSHIKTYLQTRDIWRDKHALSLVFLFYSNIVSHQSGGEMQN